MRIDEFAKRLQAGEKFRILTPREEGQQAARKGIEAKNCPYNYGNSGVRSMYEYAATGNNARRDEWFAGWQEERNKVPNDQNQGRR